MLWHRLDGAVHIGALAVVDIGDALEHAHLFDAVFHPRKGLQRMADDRRGHAHGAGHGRSSQGIFQVMRSGNENLLRVADRASRAVPLPHDFAVFYKRAVFHRLRAAEKRHLALDLSRPF